MKTDIGRQFLKLIDKNFPSNNPISEIISRKTVKLSYSCTDNMEKVISKHNKKILAEETEETNKKNCNCRIKANCPVDNECLTESLYTKPFSKQQMPLNSRCDATALPHSLPPPRPSPRSLWPRVNGVARNIYMHVYF